MTDDLFTQTPKREILTISQLNRKARQLLETHLSLLWVEGEISNFAAPSSGHWYFTLKDKDAQVRCAMFRSRNNQVSFKPALGKHVVVRGRVSLYEGRGDYQLIVEHMEEAGFGVLQRAFEALKNKLGNEGLFDPEHKKTPPRLPRHIAVITSPTGAAIHDILTVLKRRFPGIPVTLLPVAVQGEGAARQIERALRLANELGEFDVILLARGGGSLEDLWPFNEEIVARAIHASAVPVVCGVGHEVDFTIADFVADARAPTPSAAAELLSPDAGEWLRGFARYEVLLQQAMLRKIEQARASLKASAARLRHPGDRLQNRAQQLDNLEMRLWGTMRHQLLAKRTQFEHLAVRHKRCIPMEKIADYSRRLEQFQRYLSYSVQQQLDARTRRLAQAVELLETMSPLKTIGRGYSLALDEEGRILRGSSQVQVGTSFTLKLAKGEVLSRVEAVNRDYDNLDATFRKK
ncbi:exodeoxyribonuclease VII large subunit [Gilvimarinus sp. F26214L]|uniref:exodeoxyribonuclease VII large subunit n=1 Tax=Gilvimarinus sp. DZF01 TaxID=3461371 RepID=UPI0040467C09